MYTLVFLGNKLIISDNDQFTIEFKLKKADVKYIPWLEIYKMGAVKVTGQCDDTKKFEKVSMWQSRSEASNFKGNQISSISSEKDV